MWQKSQSTIRPEDVDTTSSKKFVYIHRNIVEKTTEEGFTIYEYDEYKIPKEVYDIFKVQDETLSRMNDIEETITEILGGDS